MGVQEKICVSSWGKGNVKMGKKRGRFFLDVDLFVWNDRNVIILLHLVTRVIQVHPDLLHSHLQKNDHIMLIM